jgi:hypothetical protein
MYKVESLGLEEAKVAVDVLSNRMRNWHVLA